MARLKYYLDKRSQSTDGRCHVKVSLSHRGTSALFTTDIFVKPEHWNPGDKENEAYIKKTCPGYRVMNNTLRSHYERIETELLKLSEENSVQSIRDATRLKNTILDKMRGTESITFTEYFRQFISQRKKPKTAESYQLTLNKILSFNKGREMAFPDITRQWLTDLEETMKKLAVNTRSIHFRNIRAVVNSALDNEVTDIPYPFRKFQIKTQETKKRSLSIEKIREFYNFDCEKHQRIYVDLFMLSFMLIGINLVDLLYLTEGDIIDGRVVYFRRKTGRKYSILIEPEAWEIINKYRGKKYLLKVMDRYSDYINFRKRMNDNLRAVGPTSIKRYWVKERNPFYPEITSYYARHSWATAASKLDIPKETIKTALGHGKKTVTDIYIDFDMEKVDKANRLVIDAVLHPERLNKPEQVE